MPKVNTLTDDLELIGRKSDSIVLQNRLKNVLNLLQLQDKLGDSQDEGEALAKVYNIINKQ